MGSSVSKTARHSARSIPTTSTTKQATSQQVSKVQPKTVKIPTTVEEVKIPTTRQTNEEWGELLKKVSGVISTTTWDSPEQEESYQQPKQRHAAQRSQNQTSKLPTNRQHVPDDIPIDPATGKRIATGGKITSEEILQLYKLRRKDVNEWNVDKLSEKFKVPKEDLQNLLKYTRTYMGRMDPDGVIRGYYNPNPSKSISRFESD